MYYHIGYRGVGVKPGPRHTNERKLETLVTWSLDSDKIKVRFLGEFSAECATDKNETGEELLET